MNRSVIVGTGHHAPPRVVTNEELAPTLCSDPAWIESRTGIRQRRFAAAEVATSDLALEAARAALDDAGCGPADLDALIVATLSPDAFFPGSGVFLQRKLGLVDIPALDVRNQCSGFLYGLSVADAWLRAGVYQRVLLVGAETHSPGLDMSERGRAVSALFGDGAGAVVLEARPQGAPHEPGEGALRGVRLGADGRGAENLWCERPGSTSRPHVDQQALVEGRHYPQMKGRAVFRRAVEVLERELRALLEEHHIDDLQRLVLVPHQANRHINEMVAQRLGLEESQVVHTIGDYGNTTAASIPMALDIARRAGRIPEDHLVVIAAFGSGYTWGTALLRW